MGHAGETAQSPPACPPAQRRSARPGGFCRGCSACTSCCRRSLVWFVASPDVRCCIFPLQLIIARLRASRATSRSRTRSRWWRRRWLSMKPSSAEEGRARAGNQGVTLGRHRSGPRHMREHGERPRCVPGRARAWVRNRPVTRYTRCHLRCPSRYTQPRARPWSRSPAPDAQGEGTAGCTGFGQTPRVFSSSGRRAVNFQSGTGPRITTPFSWALLGPQR